MNRLTRIVRRVDALAAAVSEWACAGIMLAMVAVAGLGVVCRFAFHASLSWSEELDAYLFVWLTCLGAAVGVKLQAHPNVMAVRERLTATWRRGTGIAANVAIMCLGAVMAFYGGQLISLMGEESASSLPISMSYPTLAIPVGGALFMLHAFAHILDLLSPADGEGRGAAPPSVAADHA